MSARGENPGIQPEIMTGIALEMMARGARLIVSALEHGPHPSSVAYGPEVGRIIAADAAKLAAVRAFVQGQTRHNCGLVRTLREMLGDGSDAIEKEAGL